MCKCPVDNTWFNVENEMFPDVAIRREILSLNVKCNQTTEGCDWTGELRNVEDHLSQCNFIEIQCEFGCSQGRLLRRDVERHKDTCDKRPVTCEHCTDVMPYIGLTRHQLLDCKKIPLSCTQCGQCGIQRGVIQRHLDDHCPKVVVPCSYKQHGCSFMDKREKMSQHNQEAAHTHLSFVEKKVQTLDKQIVEMDKHTNFLTSMLDMQQMLLDEKVAEIKDLQQSNVYGKLQWKVSLVPGWDKYQSKSFYTGCPGYKVHMSLELRGHMERNQSFASLFMVLEKGQFDEELFFPFNGQCKAKVLSESAPMNDIVIKCVNIPRCHVENEISNRQRGRLRFMPTDTLLGEDYCINNNIYIDIKVET